VSQQQKRDLWVFLQSGKRIKVKKASKEKVSLIGSKKKNQNQGLIMYSGQLMKL